jgi:hypothetical protein
VIEDVAHDPQPGVLLVDPFCHAKKGSAPGFSGQVQAKVAALLGRWLIVHPDIPALELMMDHEIDQLLLEIISYKSA